VPHPRDVFVFVARVGKHEFQPAPSPQHKTGCPILKYGAKRRTLGWDRTNNPARRWVPHPRDVFVFVARVGKHEFQPAPSPQHKTGCPILKCEAKRRTLGWDRTNYAARNWVPHPRDVFVFVARVGKHEFQPAPSPQHKTGCPILEYGAKRRTLGWDRTNNPARRWVPHPRDAFVFVARVGSHAFLPLQKIPTHPRRMASGTCISASTLQTRADQRIRPHAGILQSFAPPLPPSITPPTPSPALCTASSASQHVTTTKETSYQRGRKLTCPVNLVQSLHQPRKPEEVPSRRAIRRRPGSMPP
jgi:hypothetical protein